MGRNGWGWCFCCCCCGWYVLMNDDLFSFMWLFFSFSMIPLDYPSLLWIHPLPQPHAYILGMGSRGAMEERSGSRDRYNQISPSFSGDILTRNQVLQAIFWGFCGGEGDGHHDVSEMCCCFMFILLIHFLSSLLGCCFCFCWVLFLYLALELSFFVFFLLFWPVSVCIKSEKIVPEGVEGTVVLRGSLESVNDQVVWRRSCIFLLFFSVICLIHLYDFWSILHIDVH